MSRENVEVVRRTLEAWQRDDFDAWLSELDPDVEWHTAARRLVEGAGSAYRGIDGMRELWTFWRTEAQDFEFETQELRDLGDAGVLHLAQLRWRGRASEIEVQSPLGQVITVRDGKFVRSVDYLSHEEALEAVGLSE
jgi:ketosteroid isomerase-like protein